MTRLRVRQATGTVTPRCRGAGWAVGNRRHGLAELGFFGVELGGVVAVVEEFEFAGEGVHEEFGAAAVFGRAGALAFEEEGLGGFLAGGFRKKQIPISQTLDPIKYFIVCKPI